MGRVYMFSDEAGNFDFSNAPGASRYFVLGTVVMDDTTIGEDLLRLRRELAWTGNGLESCFHATEDTQLVRDAVFDLLGQADFRADFTIFEKRKTQSHLHNLEGFYKLAWYMHMRYVGPRVIGQEDELLLVAASIGTRKRRSAIRLGIDDVISQVTRRPW